jgi:NAD+ synthase
MLDKQEITEFIKKVVEEAEAKGVVIGISGGVDSAVVAYLCVEALGKEHVIGLLMPTEYTPKEDFDDANNICKALCIRGYTVPLDPVLSTMKAWLSPVYDSSHKKAYGNMQARLRMLVQYYFANINNYLVAGTTDRTENTLGFFTKWGDGACDFEPILHLTKTEVRQLAREFRVPECIADKPSSPRLWSGHEAEKELGVSYEVVDKILSMHDKTEHKRKSIPSMCDKHGS